MNTFRFELLETLNRQEGMAINVYPFVKNFFANDAKKRILAARILHELVDEKLIDSSGHEYLNYADEKEHKDIHANITLQGENYFYSLLERQKNQAPSDVMDDTFNNDEVKMMNKKLDDILSEIKTLKLGQEIIWEDLIKEIYELRNLYHLGKKNWRQLLLGKVMEMTAGGVVSETISKEILECINPVIQNIDKHIQ